MNKSKIICHAEGDRCHGCDHYWGKADVCSHAKSGVPAVDALLDYSQLDEDGVMVAASRQAIHEVVDDNKRLRAALEKVDAGLFDKDRTELHEIVVRALASAEGAQSND